MKLKHIKPNQTEVEIGDYTVLFSYQTPVAYHKAGIGYFRTEQKYSVTTSKHINQWLEGRPAKSVPQTTIDALVK